MNSTKGGDGDQTRTVSSEAAGVSTTTAAGQQSSRRTSSNRPCLGIPEQQQQFGQEHIDVNDGAVAQEQPRERRGHARVGLTDVLFSSGGSGGARDVQQQQHGAVMVATPALHSWAQYQQSRSHPDDIVGFTNTDGTSCYVNATRTSLNGVTSFVQYLEGTLVADSDASPIVQELLRHPRSNNYLRRLVQPRDGVDWSPQAGQQDSVAFTHALLDSMMAEAGGGGDAELVNLFTLVKERVMQCVECKSVELDAMDENWMISLVYLANSLHQGFQSTVFQPVRDNYLATCPCSSGRETTFTSVVRVKKFPTILILQLNRFQTVNRRTTKVATPMTVDIKFQPTPASPPYYLKAAVLHHGESPKDGHYKSLRFNNDGSAILVDDIDCTDLTQQEAQALVNNHAYMLFYDTISSGSPDSKRLKAAAAAVAAPPAAVERVRRNILHPAGDSVPRVPVAPAQSPTTAPTAPTGKAKLIDDIVKKRKSPQFANMTLESCLKYMKILNITPVAEGGVKKVRGQLFKAVAEEIARVEPSLDNINRTLQRLGIPLLKTAPPPPTTETVAVAIAVGGVGAGDTSQMTPTATPSVVDDDCSPAAAELQSLIDKIRALSSSPNQKLSNVEKKKRGDLIRLLVLRCPAPAVLKQFLKDQQGPAGPAIQTELSRLRDQVSGFVAANSHTLELLMERIAHASALEDELDQLLAKSSTQVLTIFLEQKDQSVSNRAVKRVRQQTVNFIRANPDTISQLRDAIAGSAALGHNSSLSSSLDSTGVVDITNTHLVTALTQFDQLSGDEKKTLGGRLKCTNSQLKKRLLKLLVDRSKNSVQLRKIIRGDGQSPQKGLTSLRRQVVSNALKKSSMLTKIIRNFEQEQSQSSAPTAAGASSASSVSQQQQQLSTAAGASTAAGSDSEATQQQQENGMTAEEACQLLTDNDSPLASRSLEELLLLQQTIFNEESSSSGGASRDKVLRRTLRGLSVIILSALSHQQKVFLMKYFAKRVVRNEDGLDTRLLNIMWTNPRALEMAVELVGCQGQGQDGVNVPGAGVLTHNYHPDNIEDILANKIQYEEINVLRSQNLQNNNYDIMGTQSNNPVLVAGEQFATNMANLTMSTCAECCERWTHSTGPISHKCPRCSQDRSVPTTFSPANNMHPGGQPAPLRNLTLIEKLSISKICSQVSVVKLESSSATVQAHIFHRDAHINELNVLPRTPDNLGLSVVVTVAPLNLRANRERIREALVWLKANNPYYDSITISEEALELYPGGGGGNVVGLPQIDTASVDGSCVGQQQQQEQQEQQQPVEYRASMSMAQVRKLTEREKLLAAVRQSEQRQAQQDDDGAGTAPPPSQATSQQQNWQDQLAVQSREGYFTKSFPHLFPTAAAEFNVPRPGKAPSSLLSWAAHLTRLEFDEIEESGANRFATDWRFIHLVTNIHLRKESMRIGRVFTTRALADPNMTVSELRGRIQANDPHIIGNIMLMGAMLPGTRAYWSYQERKMIAYQQFIEHMSDGMESFNLFLTFSLGDQQLQNLHRLFPESVHYLNKIVVNNAEDIPPGQEQLFITRAEDRARRRAAVCRNCNIVTSWAQKRMMELMNCVLGPAYGCTEIVVRSEFANARAPHFHVVAKMECDDMLPGDIPEACRSLFIVEESPLSGPELESAKLEAVRSGQVVVEPGEPVPPPAIAQARQRVGHAVVNSMGIRCVHPGTTVHTQQAPVELPQPGIAEDVLRTAFSPAANLNEDLTQLVQRVQVHHCSNRCRREGAGQQVHCSAGYPIPLAGYELNNGLQREADTYQLGYEFVNDLLSLLRNHDRVVAHNPDLVLIWRGNTNAEPIRDKYHLYEYVLKEAFKEETRSMSLHQLMTSLAAAGTTSGQNNNTTAAAAAADGHHGQQHSQQTETVVQNIFEGLSGEKEYSLPECLHLINGDQLVRFSREFQTVNLRQTRMLRLDERGEERASRENHYDKYIRRHEDANYLRLVENFNNGSLPLPKDPALLSLYDFACSYSLSWEFQPRLKIPLPTPLYKYVPRMYLGENMAWNPHHLEYCRTRLQLFKPNTTPENILGQFSNLHDALMDFVRDEDSACPQWLKTEFLVAVNKQQQHQEQTDDGNNGMDDDMLSLVGSQLDIQSAAEAEADTNHLREEERQRLAGMGVNDINAVVTSLTTAKDQYDHEQQQQDQASEPHIPPSSLNTTQRAAFNLVIHHLREGKQALYDISGKAGCGKSHFVKCLVSYIKRHFGEGVVHVVAPTGAAACQFIGGQTLHSFLKLPIKGKEQEPFSPMELGELQQRWRNLRIVICDEKSLTSLPLLHMSSTQLQKIFANSDFGGLSIMIVGDLSQLPPVGGICLYNTDRLDNLEANLGRDLYRKFDRYSFTFEQQCRQAGHESFSEQLVRLGDGQLGYGDWCQWVAQSWTGMSDATRATFSDAILLAPRRDMLTERNNSRMASLGTALHTIQAYNSPASGAAIPADTAEGLPNKLTLAVGGRVLLTRNLWTECSLVNGSMGTIKLILYKEGNNSSMPDAILIQFDGYHGPSCLPDMDRVVALTPVTASFEVGNQSYLRKSYPLELGYALTIHRAQGMTLPKVLIDLGQGDVNAALCFTAMSRVRRLEDLAFYTSIPNQHYFKVSSKKSLHARLREEERKNALSRRLLQQLASGQEPSCNAAAEEDEAENN